MHITKVLWPHVGNLYERLTRNKDTNDIAIPKMDDHNISATDADDMKIAWFKSELRSHSEQRRIWRLIADKYPMVYEFVMNKQSR